MRVILHMAAALSLVVAPALAEETSYARGGETLFTFDAPAGWTLAKTPEIDPAAMPEGENPIPPLITLRPPGEQRIMWGALWSPDYLTDLAETDSWLDGLLPRLMDWPEVKIREPRDVGGLPAEVATGSGERNGRMLDFALGAVQIAEGRVAVAAFIGEPGAFDRHEHVLVALFESIRAAETIR
ncbi:hypothetical protein G5B40_03780 [Pikeienuella piscinae]|uniref:DUF1795 domain-containing protein n=1 Tax=Pikeienuella piscinae TaxID=2748098 RepID=A0A7L5BT36_9RHOB|nr:hypothetical protein [Pikeienuella piscinae]QIE54635.1 hypothetical protein G5B40_03780 [Pikeienuella piscinae]